MLPKELKNRLQNGLEGSQVWVNEFSGGTDHYEVIVVSPEFEGKIPLKRQRLVMALVKDELDSGEVHALSIKAFSPEQWQSRKEEFEPYLVGWV